MHDRTTQALLDRARQQAEGIRAEWARRLPGPAERAAPGTWGVRAEGEHLAGRRDG